jgi:hypothetical protein
VGAHPVLLLVIEYIVDTAWEKKGFNLMLLLRAWVGNFLAVMLWAFCSLIPSRKLRLAQNYTSP